MTAEPAAAAGPSTYNVAELVTVWVVAAVIVGIMNLLNLCVVIAPVMVFVWARTATSDISVVIAVWAPPVMLKVVRPPETAAWVRLRRAAGFVVPIPTPAAITVSMVPVVLPATRFTLSEESLQIPVSLSSEKEYARAVWVPSTDLNPNDPMSLDADPMFEAVFDEKSKSVEDKTYSATSFTDNSKVAPVGTLKWSWLDRK